MVLIFFLIIAILYVVINQTRYKELTKYCETTEISNLKTATIGADFVITGELRNQPIEIREKKWPSKRIVAKMQSKNPKGGFLKLCARPISTKIEDKFGNHLDEYFYVISDPPEFVRDLFVNNEDPNFLLDLKFWDLKKIYARNITNPILTIHLDGEITITSETSLNVQRVESIINLFVVLQKILHNQETETSGA